MWKILFEFCQCCHSVLQSLVLVRFICFLLLVWQQVVIVGSLGTDFVTENCIFSLLVPNLACSSCLLNGKVMVWGFFDTHLGILVYCNYLFECFSSFHFSGSCSHWSSLKGDYGVGFFK